MSLTHLRGRRPLGAPLVAACLGLAACDGDVEQPTTQVVVPTATATPEAPTGDQTFADGYLINADAKTLVLRTQEGAETFYVSRADLPVLGIPHLQSHAGITSIGFRVEFIQVGKKRFAKTAMEIAPPF